MKVRYYAGETDLQSIIDLRRATLKPGQLADYPHPDTLTEILLNKKANSKGNTRLWEDSTGKLIGAATLHLPWNNLLFFVHPSLPTLIARDIQSQMIAWGIKRLRQIARERDEPIALDVPCQDNDTARIALLQSQGFSMMDEYAVRMVRSLNDPIPEPQLPEGFILRHIEGEHEAEKSVELHRAAFGTEHATVEDKLFEMRQPNYLPELDLIAVTLDGAWAAFCTCSIDIEESARTGHQWGWTDPIGTRPAYQRRGLARALVLAGLRALKVHGVETAVLGTRNTNTAAIRLYESLGYRVISKLLWYTKPLY